MKKKIILFILLCILCFFNTIDTTLAHPGRTNSSGCHRCKTNCARWGLSNGEYHCHNGGSSSKKSTSKSNSSKKKNTTIQKRTNSKKDSTVSKKVVKKSNDTSLKSIMIDDNNIVLNKELLYETKKESVKVKATPKDSKAKITISSTEKLKTGNNKIFIVVTAESGTKKEYILTINRIPLSDNKNIKIFVDNNLIKFKNYKSDLITVESKQDMVDIKYQLEDKYATAEIIKDDYLKIGKNTITVIVTAENGSKENYTIEIEKHQAELRPIDVIFVVGFLQGGYILLNFAIYYLLDKLFIKKKITK